MKYESKIKLEKNAFMIDFETDKGLQEDILDITLKYGLSETRFIIRLGKKIPSRLYEVHKKEPKILPWLINDLTYYKIVKASEDTEFKLIQYAIKGLEKIVKETKK